MLHFNVHNQYFNEIHYSFFDLLMKVLRALAENFKRLRKNRFYI